MILYFYVTIFILCDFYMILYNEFFFYSIFLALNIQFFWFKYLSLDRYKVAIESNYEPFSWVGWP